MSSLLELFFPPYCVSCGQVLEARGFFCAECDAEVAALPSGGCVRCAEPGQFAGEECPRCEARPPPFSRVLSPFSHAGAIARAIHLFKYEDRPELAAPLGELLVRTLGPGLGQAAVCAIPLHASRFRERKYDQAHLLAVEIARAARLEYLPRALERTRATARQVGLEETAREANVKDAFSAREVAGRALLLVDDVFTTGATARAAASALRDAGAAEIRVLTVARAHNLG